MDYERLLITIGLIISLCSFLDWISTPEEDDKNKLLLTKWYALLADYSYAKAFSSISLKFLSAFDAIYGKKHLSLRCFFFSVFISISLIFILFLCFFPIPLMIEVLYTKDNMLYFYQTVFFLIFVMVVNSIIDYFSLLETRKVLQVSSKAKAYFIPILLIIDILLTIVIFFTVQHIVISFGVFGFHIELVPPINEWMDESNWFFTLAFISTFFTSIVYYLFVLFHMSVKILSIPRERIMQVIIRIEKSDHVYKSVGGAISVLLVMIKTTNALIGSYV